ncbi:MAG: hypothetical protein AB2L14_10210 [Candidatus Xenobiia bacterium LiM19]
MNKTEIVEQLRNKLSISSGRHLYGILGTYTQLEDFARALREAKTTDGKRFPEPLSVNDSILHTIPDDKFRRLVENEAKRPEPTKASIEKAFVEFLKSSLKAKGLIVLREMELIFAYQIELGALRTHATDDRRIILLLPGHRRGGRILLFQECGEDTYALPTNLIAENNMWELGK